MLEGNKISPEDNDVALANGSDPKETKAWEEDLDKSHNGDTICTARLGVCVNSSTVDEGAPKTRQLQGGGGTLL
jgi:hypothetical protein